VVWRLQGDKIKPEGRALAARVLGEGKARDHWRPYLAGPTECFVAISGVKADDGSETTARRRLHHLEPWLVEDQRDRTWLERAVSRLISG
jgi:hypothetical protein